jgi:anti-sigma B factor antagonist
MTLTGWKGFSSSLRMETETGATVMHLETEALGDGLLVTVHAERIDAASAIQFKDRMRDIAAGAEGRVVLDMGHVDFIDSSGLGAIVAAMKAMPEGKRLELAALQPKVVKVFRLTRMNDVFVIHDDPDVARAAGANAA